MPEFFIKSSSVTFYKNSLSYRELLCPKRRKDFICTAITIKSLQSITYRYNTLSPSSTTALLKIKLLNQLSISSPITVSTTANASKTSIKISSINTSTDSSILQMHFSSENPLNIKGLF